MRNNLPNYKSVMVLLLFTAGLLSSCTKKEEVPDSVSEVNFSTLTGAEQIFDSKYLENGNCIVVGHSNGDGFMMMYDSEGKVLWNKYVGGVEDENFYKVIITSDNHLLVAGTTKSELEGASYAGVRTGFVLKLSMDGAIVWKKSFGGESDVVFYGLAEGPDGNYIATGNQSVKAIETLVVKFSKDGAVLWDKIYSIGNYHNWGQSVIFSSSGNIVIGGLCSRGNTARESQQWETYILSINPADGIIRSSRIFRQYPRENVISYQLPQADLYLEMFPTSNGFDIFTYMEESGPRMLGQVIQVDLFGNVSHEFKITGLHDFLPSQVIKTKDNGYLLMGISSNAGIGSWGFISGHSTVVKLDANGVTEWTSYHGAKLGIQSCLNARETENGYQIVGMNGDYLKSNMSFMFYKLDKEGNVL